MTVYNVDVTWNDLHMGFMEVTGLDRSGILTLKRGVMDRRHRPSLRLLGMTRRIAPGYR